MNTKTKIAVAAGIVVVAAIGIYFASTGTPTSSPASSTSSAVKTDATGVPITPGETLKANNLSVTYTDSGFSPGTLTVKLGDTVTFVNNSSHSMWPAVNPHPVHTDYPVKGHCVNGAFDACQSIDSGSSWSFKFYYAGTWSYHDHLHPDYQAKIVVQ